MLHSVDKVQLGIEKAMRHYLRRYVYLAVDQPGHLLAGETFDLLPDPPRLRNVSMTLLHPAS